MLFVRSPGWVLIELTHVVQHHVQVGEAISAQNCQKLGRSLSSLLRLALGRATDIALLQLSSLGHFEKTVVEQVLSELLAYWLFELRELLE